MGQRQVIHQRFTIHVFPNQAAMPGQYTFPYNIAIPYGCPSSAYYAGSESSVASIKYSIKAILQPSVNVHMKEMDFKQPLVMREKAPQIDENLYTSVNTAVNSCCCCCSKGRVAIQTSFEKNAYSSAETCRAVSKSTWILPNTFIMIIVATFII
jgi:hypothetical protein